ncbi:MAG: hypothetical protein OQJ97_06775 [Rhodospirillales bacterium]|nr:hypothetical protein [Rhodospirillales bacterium]
MLHPNIQCLAFQPDPASAVPMMDAPFAADSPRVAILANVQAFYATNTLDPGFPIPLVGGSIHTNRPD